MCNSTPEDTSAFHNSHVFPDTVLKIWYAEIDTTEKLNKRENCEPDMYEILGRWLGGWSPWFWERLTYQVQC
jgi:hypothetical protein